MKMGLCPNPSEEIREAWDNVMFNEFHDILCGCTVRSAAEDALDMFSQSRAAASKMLHKTLGKLCKQINTQIDGVTGAGKENWQIWEEADNGVPLVLFNPHAYPVRYLQQVNAQLASVCDEKGKPVPVQYVYGDSVNMEDKYDTLFPAEIPAMGYAVYWVYKNRVVDPAVPAQNSTKGWEQETERKLCLENQYLSVAFDSDTGWISSMVDKKTGQELLQSPSGIPVVLDDSDYDTWAHYVFAFRKELAKLKADSIGFCEKGCNRSAIRVKYTYGNSKLWVEYLLGHGQKFVEIRIKALWQEPHTQLKLAFTPELAGCRSVAEIPYGIISRPSNGDEQPMLRWCGLMGMDPQGEQRGLAVVNDSKYSYDALDNELRVTLLRNCMFADHMGKREDTVYDFVDEGVHHISLALLPYEGEDTAEAFSLADLMNCPPVAVFDTYHPGVLPREKSFLCIDDPHVALTALKPSEDGKGFVLRLAELSGKQTVCHLTSEILGLEAKLPFAPMEVKTLKVSGPDAAVEVTNFLE